MRPTWKEQTWEVSVLAKLTTKVVHYRGDIRELHPRKRTSTSFLRLVIVLEFVLKYKQFRFLYPGFLGVFTKQNRVTTAIMLNMDDTLDVIMIFD